MFEVTDKAVEMIRDMTKEMKAVPGIRVVLESVGCSGPILGLAVEEANENDVVFETGGFKFVIDKPFYEKIKPIKVEYIENERGRGFDISSSIPKSADTTSCGGGCTSCG
jgi:iron-sulfur cluster assembly protein